jgi:hypothetical protein
MKPRSMLATGQETTETSLRIRQDYSAVGRDNHKVCKNQSLQRQAGMQLQPISYMPVVGVNQRKPKCVA